MSELVFPFEHPYSIQLQARTIIEKKSKFVYMEMPTGTGKTVVLLTALLGHEKQLHYYCQSHDQADIVIEEIERINETNNTNYKVVHMAGRSKLCVALNVLNTNMEYDRIQTCKINRSQYNHGTMTDYNRSCCTDKDKVDDIQETAITLAVMNDKAVETGICPRTIMSHAVETADVIVMPYNYLANPHPSMQLDNCIAIMDEAHGIDSKIIDLATIRFDSRSIESLHTWCRKHSSVGVWAIPLADNLFDLLELLQVTLDSFHPFSNNLMYGSKIIFNMDTILRDVVSDADNEFSGFDRSDYPASMYHIMSSVAEYVQLVKNKPMWGHYAIVFDHNIDEIVMRIRPMTPAFAIRKFVQFYDQVILASGTLNIPQITRTLRIRGSDRISLPSIHTGALGVYLPSISVDGVNVNLNTLSSQRGTEMWRRYAMTIAMVSKFTPSGMLAFSPSYRISEGIRAGLQRLQVEFPVYTKLDDYLDYMQNDNNHALFISSYRGSGSEGVNFPDHYARAIFLCGVPRLPPTTEIREQIKYYNKSDDNLGELYEKYSAMIPVAQAFGRGVRHPDDWCVSYFMDTRFPQYKNFLPRWVNDSVDWDERTSWIKKVGVAVKFVKNNL